MKIWIRLAIYFLVIAASAMVFVGVLSYREGKEALERESFNRLTAVREMKASQIEDYFELIRDQITTFAVDPTVVRATKSFERAFDSVTIDLRMNSRKMMRVDSSLNMYFENVYLKKLNENLEKKTYLATEQSPNPNCRLLQTLYTVNNPNPIFEKYKMDYASDSSGYTAQHKRYHPYFREFMLKFGYYDIFLVNAQDGNIVYNVYKELDFATSLEDGPFSNTNVADVYRDIKAHWKDSAGYYAIADYEPYHPSYNQHAAFIGAPIILEDSLIGVLIFQMPIDKIDDVMTNKKGWEKVGLGKTGETYLVGNDYKIRNQSRFLIEDSAAYFRMITDLGTDPTTIRKIRNLQTCIGLQEVKTEGTEAALTGETGEKIFDDYRGVAVLSAYRPLNIPGLNWAIMSEIDEEEAFEPVYTLRLEIILGCAVLALLLVVVSYFISRSFSRPLAMLSQDAIEVAKGNFDVEIQIQRKDEIGVLATSFRKMQHSLNKLISELKDINQNLENKVAERTAELNFQKELIEVKNKEVVDSINYAKRLQHAILPDFEEMYAALGDSFLLYKPKDIVSGDFYWMFEDGDTLLAATVDCTGHGVPGAMVSVVGANSLDRCVREFGLRKPSEICEKLSDLVELTFATEQYDVRDGMDLTLISFNRKTKELQYCGAHNPLWIIRNNTTEIQETKADKQPIGKYDYRKPFTNHSFQMNTGDLVYLFSDGFADQFGGPLGKKFKHSTLKKLLLEIYTKPLGEQHEILSSTFETWRGNLEQNDDVCMIAFRIP
jgi:serine phosphatase RsbU (regulator of sigma subunit)